MHTSTVILLGLAFLAGIAGCESSSSVTVSPPKSGQPAARKQFAVKQPSVFAEEAAEKYKLGTQLLNFAGPIDDLSPESENVRWLASDLFHDAIKLDPTEFRYYRELFMTYMVLQEPIKALDAIEPALGNPKFSAESAEFNDLLFGALEFLATLDPQP